jgi:hypothetical protein
VRQALEESPSSAAKAAGQICEVVAKSGGGGVLGEAGLVEGDEDEHDREGERFTVYIRAQTIRFPPQPG